MENKKDNLELWHKVEKTNPNYTKQANVKGNKITSISPQFQVMNVTEQFGVYGQAWGFKSMELDYTLAETLGLVVLHAVFFFPNGEFPIKNAISLFMDNAKTKVDDNFAKKLETDTLTKAVSKLGFNADIFLGKFDDLRYLEEVKNEFKSPKEIEAEAEIERVKQEQETALKQEQERNDARLRAFTTVDDLGTFYKGLSVPEKHRTKELVGELKIKLENQIKSE